MASTVVQPVSEQPPTRGVIEQLADRKGLAELGLARPRLDEVDRDNPGSSLEVGQEGEGVLDMLDDVEREREVPPIRDVAVEVEYLGLEFAALQSPSEVAGARAVEVGEANVIAG